MRHPSIRVCDEATNPPRHCPTCGQDLSEFPYYRLLPGPFARRLRTLAKLLLPVMAVVFLVHLFSGYFPLILSMVSGYFIVAYISTPSLALYAVSVLIPRIRRVICLHCSWYRDYPFQWGPFEARTETPKPAARKS